MMAESPAPKMSANMFLSLLLLLFIGLKLSGHIDWSWWWVLSPFWIPALLACLIGCVYVVAAVRK